MKRYSELSHRNPARDLFGEVPVSVDEVRLWCVVVAHLAPDSPRLAYYVRAWRVVEKVQAYFRRLNRPFLPRGGVRFLVMAGSLLRLVGGGIGHKCGGPGPGTASGRSGHALNRRHGAARPD